MALQRLRAAQQFVEAQMNFSQLEVLELVGTGANGVVFKCRSRDARVQGDLAVKIVINYGSDPQVLLGSAVQEQSALSHLPPHRNIVEILGTIGPAPIPQQIFDLCPDLMKEASSRNDAVGIVMRYHPQDLEHCITRSQMGSSGHRLDPYDVFGMCLDVVLALRHLQRYRSLHFDVKLNNFLVAKDLTLILADFGCAQQCTRDDWMVPLQSDSTNVGNSSHLAPEVLRALQTTHTKTPGTSDTQLHAPDAMQEDGEDGAADADGAGGEATVGGGGAAGGLHSARYYLPCRRQLEFAAGVLLYELLFPKTHPYEGYPLNLTQLVSADRARAAAAAAAGEVGGAAATTTTTTNNNDDDDDGDAGDGGGLLGHLEREMDAKIAGLRQAGFTARQVAALHKVLRGLLQVDPARRTTLEQAVRVLGSVDKTAPRTATAAAAAAVGGGGAAAVAEPADTTTPAETSKAVATGGAAAAAAEAGAPASRLLEIWVLGASYVGKSLLMSAFTGAPYAPVTVGVNSSWRNVRPGMPKGFQVRLWDTAGQRIFRNSMAGLTSRDAFVMLVFDVTAPDSFAEVRQIHAQLREKGRMAACVVVANKTDLGADRQVTYAQGLRMAEELGAEGYFETSAKTDQGVHELFLSIFQIADRLDHIIAKPASRRGARGSGAGDGARGDGPPLVVEGAAAEAPRKKGCCS